jgi:Zn-dependent oligopeptidase
MERKRKYDEKKKKFWVNCSGRDDIGTDYPIIKKYCTVKETREKVTFLNESSVGEKNNKKLREILKLRNEIIKMLGQKNWSSFVVKEEMMNEPKKIVVFLKSLIEKLTPQYLTEKSKIEILLKERGEKLTTASYAFGKNLLSKKDSSINEDLYKPYFELNSVLSVLFKTWENLFDIKAEFIKDVKILHEDTLFYKFTDTKSGDLLGHGILDLHPRTGKYGHACVADIFKKYESMDDKKHAGLTYLICNFKKVVEGKTFITISDMNTLYHEAGHMLHMILMKNKYISTSSTSRDFVEIPSQFHENFLLNKNFVAENFKIAREFFLNILPIRDNNYFFNTKRLNQIELDDIIYFLYVFELSYQ